MTATELDTLGIIILRYKSANTAEFNLHADVVAININDVVRAGLTALPNAAAQAAGGLYTRGTGAGQINQAANGMIDTSVVRWLNVAPNALISGRVDASVGAMAANVITAAATAPDFSTEVNTGVATAAGVAALQTDVDDIQTRLPAALVGGKMDAVIPEAADRPDRE